MARNSQSQRQWPGCNRSVCVLMVAGILVALGCGKVDGPALATVTGTVTKDGAPVPNAVVIFTPTTAGVAQASGGVNADGVYQLKYANGQTGAPLGECRVELMVSFESGSEEGGAPSQPPVTYTVSEAVVVPKGENQFDFQLEKLGRPRQ
jgi:hypothetical protein